MGIDTLEALRLLRQLQLDVIRADEDWLEALPVSLDLEPGLDHLVNLTDGLKLTVDLVAELFNVLLRKHTHEDHLIRINELLDLADILEEWNV